MFLDLRDKACLVIGEGPLAEEKARGLEDAGARVARLRTYTGGVLQGHFLAVLAEPGGAAHAAAFHEAEASGVLFNALDDSPHCRFVYPAVYREGDLVVAVSTGGACPALAVRLRDRIARNCGPHYAAFLRLMRGWRGRLTETFPEFGRRRKVWYRLVDCGALEALAAGDQAGAEAKVNATIAEESACRTY